MDVQKKKKDVIILRFLRAITSATHSLIDDMLPVIKSSSPTSSSSSL
jgi:hypothetical protein